MKTSKSRTTPTKPKTATSGSTIYIVGGLILLATAGGLYWYYQSKKRKQHQTALSDPDLIPTIPDYQTPPIVPIQTSTTTTSTASTTVIKTGSRHPDVKILQRYLKNRGAYLGRSGKNKDGVDGIFGPLTAKAARALTGKTVFTSKDIQKYKSTL